MSTSKRVTSNLSRDLFVLEDENNPRSTQVDTIYPSTILDQVFDDQSPTNKTLRQILEELKQEIITGGRGNIVFPVTSVNGMTDDVVLDKITIGLGRVDNTADIDKPLSIPQRTAIEEILAHYDFHINLDDLYNHITDHNNPHNITLEQLNSNQDFTKLINESVITHNLSKDRTTHLDIRNSLSRLWILVDGMNDDIEHRISYILDLVSKHIESEDAHYSIFEKKENISNKVTSIDIGNNITYPSTKAVMEYLSEQLDVFRSSLPDVQNWIDDIIIIKDHSELPVASKKQLRKAYIVKEGTTSFQDIAICRIDSTGTYLWDISSLGTYSKFHPDYFVDTASGLSINLGAVVDAVLNESGELNTSLSDMFTDYYDKTESDDRYIRSIKIMPGSTNASIKFYINNDMSTMSEDIQVGGLHTLAFKDTITELELEEGSVWNRHIINKAVENRHINDRAVSADKMYCTYGYILGNTLDEKKNTANEITLVQLADILRPLIGGWPDPNTPGGNPWQDILDGNVIHPHRLDPRTEYPFMDGSYARRFIGEINSVANNDVHTFLTDVVNVKKYRLLDAGGSWCYRRENGEEEWTVLGSANLTGHTFASVYIANRGLYLDSLSNCARDHAKYDIWVRYCPIEQVNEYTE